MVLPVGGALNTPCLVLAHKMLTSPMPVPNTTHPAQKKWGARKNTPGCPFACALILGPCCDSVLSSEKYFTHSCSEMHPNTTLCYHPSWTVFSISPVKHSLVPDAGAVRFGPLGCTGYLCGSCKMAGGPSGLVGTATPWLVLGEGRDFYLPT